jgi:hypothetical protein
VASSSAPRRAKRRGSVSKSEPTEAFATAIRRSSSSPSKVARTSAYKNTPSAAKSAAVGNR